MPRAYIYYCEKESLVPTSYKPVSKSKASDQIIEEIWASILNGDLKPGDRLPPERELVVQFGVSKVTLREALQSLEANGYIERKRGASGGSIVKEISPTQGIKLLTEYLNIKKMSLNDLIQVRMLFEPSICEEAASMITEEKAHQLELMLEKHQQEYEATGKSKFGLHFEQYLARLTGNIVYVVIEDLLINLVRDMEQEILEATSVNDEERSRLLSKYYSDTFEEHRTIAEAIIRHDSVGARNAVIVHRQNWAKIFRKLCKESSGQ